MNKDIYYKYKDFYTHNIQMNNISDMHKKQTKSNNTLHNIPTNVKIVLGDLNEKKNIR